MCCRCGERMAEAGRVLAARAHSDARDAKAHIPVRSAPAIHGRRGPRARMHPCRLPPAGFAHPFARALMRVKSTASLGACYPGGGARASRSRNRSRDVSASHRGPRGRPATRSTAERPAASLHARVRGPRASGMTRAEHHMDVLRKRPAHPRMQARCLALIRPERRDANSQALIPIACRISPLRSARLWAAPASAVRPSSCIGAALAVNS